MKAMILAAGRGKRMGKLTEKTPKPLLEVDGCPLIVHQIRRLERAGFIDLVINLGYLGEQICDYLGDGRRYGVNIDYSVEPQSGLETGGGVYQALPLLGMKPFLLTNADVFCDFPYEKLRNLSIDWLHLVLVPNPSFKPVGDFGLSANRLIADKTHTFSGISVVSPELFATCQAGFFPLAPLFYQAVKQSKATAQCYQGQWFDVGTPARLAQVNQLFEGGESVHNR